MKKTIQIIAFLTAITAYLNISNFDIIFGVYYYYIYAILLVIVLIFNKKLRINNLVLLLIVASLASIMFNKIPTVFSPYSRFLAFVVLISLIGPFLNSKALSNYRNSTFNIFNFLIIIFVITSFIALIMKLPTVFGRSGFTGFFGNSMLLGPMSAIAILTLIKNAYSSKNKLKRIIYPILAFISFVVCVAAGSRAALIAGLAGILFFIYKINQKKLTRFLTFTLIIGSVLIVSYPLWEQYADRIIAKMSYAEDKGDLTVSRTAIWALRIEEFRSSPIIGVGFASVDISILSTRFDPYEGRVEPGSSWLAGLSMIGFLGFIPFIILVFGYMKFIVNDSKTVSQSAFLGSLLILYFIHMIAEGYIFSAGSGLFFYLWLLLGVIESLKSANQKVEQVNK